MIYYLNNEKGLNMSDFKKGDIVSLKTGSEPIIVSEVSYTTNHITGYYVRSGTQVLPRNAK